MVMVIKIKLNFLSTMLCCKRKPFSPDHWEKNRLKKIPARIQFGEYKISNILTLPLLIELNTDWQLSKLVSASWEISSAPVAGTQFKLAPTPFSTNTDY